MILIKLYNRKLTITKLQVAGDTTIWEVSYSNQS